MEPALDTLPLHRGASVAIHDVRCRAHRSGPGVEERVSRLTVSVPRRGVFVKHDGGGTLTADPSRAVVLWPDRAYRVSHPTGGGDDCTAIEFDAATLRDAAAHFGLDPDDGTARTATSGGPGLDLFRLVVRLRQGLRAGRIEPMVVEEAAFGILAAVLRGAAQRRGRQSARSATRRAHARVVETTREAIATHFHEPLRLADLARQAGVSPFHLARVFRAGAGRPVHRHLNDLRLRAALARVADGAGDLTAVALDCGFSSHSHLTNAFRRAFGAPPSRVRRPPSPAEIVRASKLLQARAGTVR